ncbi:diaminopimelate decarboxylase [Lactobacillus sp. CBA3605]|uniref:diaminopimelate decarboxylase n=1 Tax=Lactobacillus sp. CBA3605 TaxID=2099788 RepID=UPI000CFD5A20|nr:diaminopimelate decarboxylase [Lactobacillus sp. CBA3605]AVK60325.1 diaminopimelate decarboxylase [Lactobacillus sp. CBA3605]
MNEQITPAVLNTAKHLTVGGVDTLALAQQYQTPLYVYDTGAIRTEIAAFKQVFEANQVHYQISYASKAFATVAMYQLAAQAGIHCDVVSGGELYTAKQADFPMAKLSFHGNNKSIEELTMALDYGVGCIMVDNFYELQLLAQLTAEREQLTTIMLRIAPGISAHTHEYISTGQADSKFGFDLTSGQADTAVKQAQAAPYLDLVGIHCHIGSQIFEVDGFKLIVDKLVALFARWQTELNFYPKIMNVGGGFGVKYTSADQPLLPTEFVDAIIKETIAQTQAHAVPMLEIWIEPGRSLVATAGMTLYTLGATKEIPGIRKYLAVDGGMGDNIRPALYEAKYEAVLAKNPTLPSDEVVSIAGKYCESGDMLIWNQQLPATQPGDILAVLDTGAYGYSMASNYNRNPRPAVVFCEDGHSQLVVQRETYADLVRLDVPLVTKVNN